MLFGRESIDEWMASTLVKGVDPKFNMGTNVLAIKYKSGDPNQAALIANAFLASTIDGSVAMKAAAADQTARWFAPQIEELRKDLETSRAALEAFQAQTNMVSPTEGGDSETSQYMAISQQLSAARAQLNTLQSRLTSGSTDLSNDPADPDLQILANLKEKLSTSQSAIEAAKSMLGANNPKMMAELANLASIRKQIGDATEKMRQHLKERIATTQAQIASLQTEEAQAQKTLIEVQAQRDRLGQLQHDVAFRAEQLNARERAAEEAKLKSKLTFSNMTVLDKATPPLIRRFQSRLLCSLSGSSPASCSAYSLRFSRRRLTAGSASRSISRTRPRPRSWAVSKPCDARKRAAALMALLDRDNPLRRSARR